MSMVGRSFKPAGAKPAAPQAAAVEDNAAPVAAAGSFKGTKPTKVLKFKNPETGKYERITGLFESEGKDGSKYLKGTDKESGVSYIVVDNDGPRKQA
jgi:hypothetical protein